MKIHPKTKRDTPLIGSFTGVGGTGSPPDLGDLGDVDLITTPPNVGDIIIWDGTNWVVAPGDSLHDHSTIDATETFDLADGSWHIGVLGANLTATVTGFTATEPRVMTIGLTQDGTGGRTITWDADVDFGGGDDQPSSTAGSITWFSLWSVDGDSTIYAAKVGGSGSSMSFATPAIVLGTAAAAGAATTTIRSDSTIVAFDATVPTTQAFGDSAATGSAAVAARRDHKHGMPSSSGGALMISDTHSSPLVFDDILQSDAGDDFLYMDE